MNKTKLHLKSLINLKKSKALSQSSSLNNNVGMKYRYEKMKLSQMSHKLFPNLNREHSNLFFRLKSHKGVHMDKDIVLPQQILYSLKNARINKKQTSFTFSEMYDIATVVNNSEKIALKTREIIQKHQKKIQSKHNTNILPHQNSLSKMLLLAESDEINFNDTFLSKNNNNTNSNSNKNMTQSLIKQNSCKDCNMSKSINSKDRIITLRKQNKGKLLRKKFNEKNKLSNELFEIIENPSSINHDHYKMNNHLCDNNSNNQSDSFDSLNESSKKKNDYHTKSLSYSTQFIENKPMCYIPNLETNNQSNVNKNTIAQSQLSSNSNNNLINNKIQLNNNKSPVKTHSIQTYKEFMNHSSTLNHTLNSKFSLDQIKKINKQTMESYAKKSSLIRKNEILIRRKYLNKIQNHLIILLDQKEDAMSSKIVAKSLLFKLP